MPNSGPQNVIYDMAKQECIKCGAQLPIFRTQIEYDLYYNE